MSAVPPSLVFSEVASAFSSSRFVTEGTTVKSTHVPGQSPLGKTLYEQLRENKDKKDELFKEQSRFKGPKALDDDEAQFLTEQETLAKMKQLEAEIEEERQLEDFYEKKKKAHQTVVPAVEDTVPLSSFIAPVPKPPAPPSNSKKRVIKVVAVSSSSPSNSTSALSDAFVEEGASPSSTKKRKDDDNTQESDAKKAKITSTTASPSPKKEEEDSGFKLVDYGDDEDED